MSAASKAKATFADLERLGDLSAEVVRGVIVEKAAPSPDHATAQAYVTTILGGSFGRRGGGGPAAPGGWWPMTEGDVQFDVHDVYRPDVAGWRRDRVPERPRGRPVRERPDWVCEILSDPTPRHDLSTKLRAYHQFRVPHYWIVDPARETLTVHRWREEGYLIALVAGRGDRVRAEPFDAIEIQVGRLFGDD